jgi:hypothetical protein
MLRTEGFVEKNSMLVREFDRYVLEHPEFADRIPDNALVVMQMEGDPGFNSWAREASSAALEEGQPLVYVTISELRPFRSRIEKLRLEVAA